MRMRTIEAAAAEIKANDPNTALTSHAIRKLVKSGKIYSVRVGTKYLISLDSLNSFLNGGKHYENKVD